MTRRTTLWSATTPPNPRMMDYTVADDREVDQRLLRWDVIGSLGHLESLTAGGIVSRRQRGTMRRGLLAALAAVDAGRLTIGAEHEDGHSAIEFWLTRRFGDVGERIHAGRSRNDQVATALRLMLKDRMLTLHAGMCDLADVLLAFASTHRRVVWPGYTHQRAAMPSSAALWAAGYAAGLLDAADAIGAVWPRIDRSPLGSAAGYGVPLPLDREAAARALGFGGLDVPVTATQASRGQLEAAVLFWCVEAAHVCAKLSADVILFSAGEFGWLVLPPQFSTGSSIMPQKRNPDVFELTRARAAALDGDLITTLALRSKLTGGYHRDFQLLKAPLFRGLDATGEMLTMLTEVMPHLGVDAERGRAALTGGIVATDAVMERVRRGVPFRTAYRATADALHRGEMPPTPTAAALLQTRTSTGGMGNPGFTTLRAELRRVNNSGRAERRRFDTAIARLTRSRRSR